VAVIFDFWVFSLSVGRWGGVGLQALGYAADVFPILIFSPGTVRSLSASASQIALGAVFVLAAVIYAVATRLYPHDLAENIIGYVVTGICEELSFRGFIWERTRLSGFDPARLIAVNVIAFTAWHLVSVAAGDSGWSNLIGIACFGTVASIVRLRAANTGLPALLHMAVDIAGV
ncbi:MAG: CPBP family intramembrane glutamic endopeptidase, partial [Trebonia sp.]